MQRQAAATARPDVRAEQPRRRVEWDVPSKPSGRMCNSRRSPTAATTPASRITRQRQMTAMRISGRRREAGQSTRRSEAAVRCWLFATAELSSRAERSRGICGLPGRGATVPAGTRVSISPGTAQLKLRPFKPLLPVSAWAARIPWAFRRPRRRSRLPSAAR